jgi:hypothetical protein
MSASYALRVDVSYRDSSVCATLTGTGQAHATASGTAALVRALADGEVDQAGAWMPEQIIDPSRFFARLASRDLHVTRSFPTPRARR